MTVEELREVDRKVIARANNELFGSFSYFLTTADGGVFGAKGVEGAPDEHHLSKAIGELKMQANRDYHRAEAQAQEIQRLREALCFYARENNWKSVTSYMCGHGAIHCSAMADKGNKARAALSQENSDDR